MIFLSAQPDELYFKWQLEVQLFNFKKVGVPSGICHVLIACRSPNKLNPIFEELINEFKGYANFYVYNVYSNYSYYDPILRPNIIKQHFLRHPHLSKVPVFYHDSDIIFSEMPDFEALCADSSWYLSDTRDYIASYIIDHSGRYVFEEMCKVLKMDKEKIERNDIAAGGAQYLMKGINYQFWEKVESDCDAPTYFSQKVC